MPHAPKRTSGSRHERAQRWRPAPQPVNPCAHRGALPVSRSRETKKAAYPGQRNEDHVSRRVDPHPPATKSGEYGGSMMLDAAKRLIQPSARSGVPPFMVMDVMA